MGAVLWLRHFADDDAAHQRVVVPLRCLLAADDDRGEHFVALNLTAAVRLAFLLAVAVVDDGLQSLELCRRNVVVVIFVKHHRDITKRTHEGNHGSVSTKVKVEHALMGIDE